MKQLRWILFLLVIGSPGLAHATAADSNSIPIFLTVIHNGTETVFSGLEGRLEPNGQFSGGGSGEGAEYSFSWTITGDTDPFISVALAVTNLADVVSYSFLFAAPALPTGPPSVTGGTVNVTLVDSRSDGVTLSDYLGTSLYTARANNTDFHSLLDGPFSYSGAVPTASFGLPGLTEPGPPSIANILGINLNFTLTGRNDQVLITAEFHLEPKDTVVPEPASIGLVTLGLLGLGGRALGRRAIGRIRTR